MATQVCTVCLGTVEVTTWCLECRNSYVNELGLETHPTAVAAWAARRARGAAQIGQWGKQSPTDDPHLLWSKKWTRGGSLTWWCPDSQGYTTSLRDAGLYSREGAESVERSCHGDDFAIPLAMIGALKVRTVASDSGINDLVRRVRDARKERG